MFNIAVYILSIIPTNSKPYFLYAVIFGTVAILPDTPLYDKVMFTDHIRI